MNESVTLPTIPTEGPGSGTPGEKVAVELRNVGMTFRSGGIETQAIGDVSGTLTEGRFVTVIGPSGCGKSTLLDLVSGLNAKPTHGVVEVYGEPVTGPRRDTAMVFQEDSTLHWRTVLANVAFGLEIQGVPKKERIAQSRAMIELVGLSGFEDHRPRQLSGGMKQRVAIARALVAKPRIMLMDEPFGALDQQTRWLVGQELTRIWHETRNTVMFVTHDINEAVLLSDEVWIMSARPSRVKEVVTVDLPRPRPASIVEDPRYQELVARLWHSLSEEFGDRDFEG